MGYGLIRVDKAKVSLVEMGVLQLARRQDHAERLELIFRKMETLIHTHNPAAIAIEAPFFGKNVQSMLKLGRAQGVAIAAGMMHGLRAVEYAPRKIKQSITGNGNASKEQVWQLLQRTLSFQEHPAYMDATDAVAVALTHHFETNLPFPTVPLPAAKGTRRSRSAGWEQFLHANPNRIK